MRKHSVNLLFSSIVTLAVPALALTEVPKAAVVKLMAPSGGCGSAFFIDGQTLITSAHFVRASCPGGDCSDLRIGSDQSSAKLELRTLLSELDVASLKITAQTPHRALDGEHSIPPAIDQEISVLHYPACAELQITSGHIRSSTSLDFILDAAVNYGSSGGAVVDQSGIVLGVVSQAASVFGAARARLIGGSFQGQAMRYDIINSALKDRGVVSQALLSWYLSDVSNLIGFQRLYDGQRFVRAVDRLRVRLIAAGDQNPAIMLATEYPDTFATLPAAAYFGPQTIELEQLAFAASLERHGPFSGELRTLDTNALEAALQKSGRPSAHIAELRRMVLRLWEQKYPGIELIGESLVFSGCVLGLIIAAIWGWSLGRVFSKARGSLWRRAVITVMIALLIWPLSWLIFCFRSSRKAEEIAKS